LDLVFDTGKVAALQHGFGRIRQNAGFEGIEIANDRPEKMKPARNHPALE
jgi:hypothetical protein